MKHLGKLLLVPISIGLVSGLGLVNAHAEDTSDTVPVIQNIDLDLSPLSSEGIVIAENNSDTTITDNYLTLENPLDDLLRAAPKTIKVSGSMIFDKQGWPYPPKSRNWKEKRHGYWYYGKLYLQSYKSAGNNWIAQYSGALSR